MKQNIIAMKKTIIAAVLFCVTALFLLSPVSFRPITASADIGPKPSVQITFVNLGDEICYGTLLSEKQSTGPACAWDGDPDHIERNGLDPEIWEAFVAYEDADGYYFLQLAWRCDETKQLSWTYYPPSPFKVLLYFPESGTFATSGIYERYAFDSYFTVNAENVELLQAEESYDYSREIFSLFCRIIVCILLETGIAFLFRIRERNQFFTVLGVNAVTQIVLNVLLNLIRYHQGYLEFVLYYFLFEFIVFLLEAVVYSLTLPRVGKQKISVLKCVLYALVANAVSFAGGFALAYWIPGIF